MKLVIIIGPMNYLANGKQCSQLKEKDKLFEEQEGNFMFEGKNKMGD
jgi:hypothetical protein